MEVYLLLKEDLIDGEKKKAIARKKIQVEKKFPVWKVSCPIKDFPCKAPEAVVAKEKRKVRRI